LLKGKLRPENKNPINRKWKVYIHFDFCLKWRKSVAVNIVALLIGD
jgi:Cu(I)/Ag(I) efflux system membrane protein CusA/SilA